MEGVSGPIKTSRRKVSVKVWNSQAMIASKSEGVVARERMKGLLLLVGVVVAMVFCTNTNELLWLLPLSDGD